MIVSFNLYFCDVCIVFHSSGNAQETEGHDRSSLDLPGEQLKLLQDVISYGKTPVSLRITHSILVSQIVNSIVTSYRNGAAHYFTPV